MKTLLITVCSFLLLLSVSASAQTDREALIDDILTASRTREQANRVAVEVREHFAPVLKEMAAQPAGVFRTLADTVFAGDAMYTRIKQHWLAQANDTAQLRIVRNWLRSPTAVQMQQLEQEAMRPETGMQIAEYSSRLQKDTALQRRSELLMVLGDAAMRSTVLFLTDLTEQVFLLFNTPGQSQQGMTAQEIRDIVENMRKGMLEYYGSSMLGFYAYAYRSVSDEDLRNYVHFYTSTDEGKWFSTFSTEAYTEACKDASQQFVNQLQATYAGMMQKTASDQADAQTPESEEELSGLEKVHKELKEKSNGGKVIGMVEATVNSVKWYGYINAEDNHNGTITILALNKELDPMEQAEITFSFNGKGNYRIEKEFAGIYRFTADRTVVSKFLSRGAAADKITITSFDKLTNMIEGKLSFTAYGKDGDVTFTTQPFIVRLK